MTRIYFGGLAKPRQELATPTFAFNPADEMPNEDDACVSQRPAPRDGMQISPSTRTCPASLRGPALAVPLATGTWGSGSWDGEGPTLADAHRLVGGTTLHRGLGKEGNPWGASVPGYTPTCLLSPQGPLKADKAQQKESHDVLKSKTERL